MTKKHYELLAAALRKVAPPVDLPQKDEQWQDTVEAIATALAKDNSKFDWYKFYAACGKE